ncbi:MAG: DUF58 domain-containing protein, partial [Ilumatobacter sp.]
WPPRHGAHAALSMRTLPVPTGRLAALLLVAAAPFALGVFDRWWLLVSVIVVIAVLGAVDGLRAPSPMSIEVRREFPASLVLGESATLRWLVENPSDRAIRITVADALWPSLGASRRAATFDVAARSGHRFGATIEPARRGRFPFDALTVRTSGPLGLVQLQQSRAAPESLAVLPAHPSSEALRTRLRVPLETGVRSVRARGTGTDFDQLREYRPGDDIRKVDWAATARQQKAIVRDFRAERNQHVVALLDNGRAMAGTVGDTPRVEHAMDAVLGLTRVATHLGDNVGLVTFDNQVRGLVPASNSKAQFARVTEAMYLLDPSYDESAYDVAFTTAASRFRRRSLFVVFTDVVASVVADSLLPAITTLTRTHLVLVAAVRDPDVAAWATASAGSADDAFRSAAAVASLDGRDRAIALLTAAGAVVVDSRPGDLAVDVVDAYLALKVQGRL